MGGSRRCHQSLRVWPMPGAPAEQYRKAMHPLVPGPPRAQWPHSQLGLRPPAGLGLRPWRHRTELPTRYTSKSDDAGRRTQDLSHGNRTDPTTFLLAGDKGSSAKVSYNFRRDMASTQQGIIQTALILNDRWPRAGDFR